MYAEVTDNKLHILVDKEIYNEDVIHKCFYWYGADFSIDIGSHSEKLFLIQLKPKNEHADLENTIEKIKQDLIDFKLRDIVAKETKAIRELLIAKAFSYYGAENDPDTEITDPVGFSPKSIKGHDDGSSQS